MEETRRARRRTSWGLNDKIKIQETNAHAASRTCIPISLSRLHPRLSLLHGPMSPSPAVGPLMLVKFLAVQASTVEVHPLPTRWQTALFKGQPLNSRHERRQPPSSHRLSFCCESHSSGGGGSMQLFLNSAQVPSLHRYGLSVEQADARGHRICACFVVTHSPVLHLYSQFLFAAWPISRTVAAFSGREDFVFSATSAANFWFSKGVLHVPSKHRSSPGGQGVGCMAVGVHSDKNLTQLPQGQRTGL